MLDDDNDDQDILDQHVSRVWSDRTPLRSPGNLSPCNALNQFQRRKPHETAFSCGSSEFFKIFLYFCEFQFYFSLFSNLGIQSSMRVSKSMPDSNMRKFSKWGSINTDRYELTIFNRRVVLKKIFSFVIFLNSGISLFSSDTMTIKHKDAMSISSSSSGSTSKPPRPTQTLSSEVGSISSAIGGAHKLTPQQIEEIRRYFVKNQYFVQLIFLFNIN